MYKSVEHQRDMWPKCISGSADIRDAYSYGWGNPLSDAAVNVQGMVLGNYQKILREFLIPNIVGKSVIDLGCYDGKWTQFMLEAHEIICVDLNDASFKKISELIFHPRLIWYQTAGDELTSIHDHSVDFVLCMDVLVRSEVEIIQKYIHEFARVLSPDGKLCIHLPAVDQMLSRELGFTSISCADIQEMCDKAGLTGVNIMRDVVNHGVLLTKGL